MSSQISRLLADSQEALLDVAAEVAENGLFTFADASDEAAFEEAAAAADADGWLRACVRFEGPTVGHFTLTLPAALARRLCTAFSGAAAPEDLGEGDLLDFSGELANMVCGAWLTRVCTHEQFDLTPPQVWRGRLDRAGQVAPADVAFGTFYVAIDETPVRLEVGWAASTPVAGEGPAHAR